ncbi:hypothetical protein D3C83_24920 [compost metagenome]
MMPRPTPGGVPVAMMSPGMSVMYWLTCETIFATVKIMVRVLPVCMRLPFRSSAMSRPCGSRISSLVTSQGPIGPAVSKPLPLSHCVVAIWKPRSETSFTMQ